MRILLRYLTQTRIWKCLLIKIIPYIRFSMYYTKIRGYKYSEAYRRLQPGDIILTVDKKKLTSILVPGIFTHAAFCVSKNKKGFFEVAEMTHNDYTESWFFDLCKEADRIVIMECKDFDPSYKEKMIKKCLSFQGARYDITFTLGVLLLYCSELIFHTDFEKRMKLNLDDVHSLGTKYISPDGIYKCENNRVKYDTGWA